MRDRHRPVSGGAVLAACVLAIAGAAGAAGAQEGRSATSTSLWRALPRAPIAGRLPAATVWTGSEMIVWGGITSPGLPAFPSPQGDGAAYEPRARRWRAIAHAPSGVFGGGGEAAAWTGREMVVWVGNSPQGPAAAATFEPRRNTWRRLPSGPLGVREDNASVWTGRELLVFGGHTGSVTRPTGAALDPFRRSWRRLAALESLRGLAVANGAVWDGREAFVAGQVAALPSQRPQPILFAFDPRTEAVHRINLGKAPVEPAQRLLLFPMAWYHHELLLLIGARTASSSLKVLRYKPSTNRWSSGRAAPCTGATQTAWIGDGVAGACGPNGMEIYHPRTDSWQTLYTGPSPLADRQGSSIVWTGSRLIVWSGVVKRPGNPTPSDGASIALRP